MELYEYTEKFKVKYCDVDFKDELKISSLLAYLQEVACSSADELGFGYAYLKPRGYGFMVSNILVEFTRPVRLGENPTYRTWPLPPTHVVFGREYALDSEEGERLVNASSRWCLIDMTTGKLAQSKVIDNQDYSAYNTTKLFENVRWKIPVFDLSEGEERFSLKIANSEYDHNMHVNNTRYADYCLNCFSVEELKDVFVKSFMISFVKQCREGEKLRFYRKACGEGEFLTQGINEQGEIVVQASITFWVEES
jgi:acyl-ACP thioesterase